ncbi:N-6 DNA methylase [Mycobacteroides abscessus]|uniref:N-6 DNA methylase n=1 Tax=Mycobacteroides abscessus TaxID=36809 RepID=UPI0026704E39|nr:N-6 DNA methylase [Mycobacteroides abscessus]MDO3110002.1 N-6 DNA methylase [Mycobacteroides abscessus subsp. abscessus]
MTESHLDAIVARLAAQTNRPEATTQADIYALLTQADIGLSEETVTMESPIGDGTQRRVDVEIGQCVIEVKKNLHAADLAKAEEQLGGYVRQRTETFGRYVGILTDGAEWRLYQLQGDELEQISTHTLNKKSPDTQALLVWLESVMSTLTAINPVPEQIEYRLGAASPAHKLDTAELRRIYEAHKDSSEVQLKRQLWAKLLRVALGADFEDSEELFINHTLLVTTAELIAHAVLGFNVGPSGSLTARQITSGTEFANARIRGVVEADFFDWVTDTPAGESFVRNLGRRISRFDWGTVEHDVLKILYESVITKEVRESLGEYYTPDWLADRMVETFVADPLNSVIADPSCGSGTFLFHAVRRYLAAAKDAGIQIDDAVQQATNHVVGIDVHPVAVTLARVTYLLALGRDNVKSDTRKELTIPVYLGDSIQWQQETDIFGSESVRVRTDETDLFEEQGGMFSLDLHFPRSVLKDATGFDYLVSEMADKALVTEPANAKKVGLTILKRRGIAADSRDGEILRETFLNLCTLRAQGRDHIWGYYVRNLIRPLWLAEPENRVDALIGNPPWLRYNKMSASMQGRYRALAKPRNLLTGPLGASARDLSTLFVARAIELYLRKGGSFAFVMPHGILTRKPHTGFRSGDWRGDEGNHLTVRFGESWDLLNADTGFPMTSGVVHGSLSKSAGKMPLETLAWSGRLPRPDVPWSVASKKIKVSTSSVHALDHGVEVSESPYKSRFRQGAILVPRLLMFVEDAPKGPFGAGAGRRTVTSFRTNQEDKQWRDLPSLTANVEKAFIRTVYLGETILPFRTSKPREAVLPINGAKILTSDEIEIYDGLYAWWSAAESDWEQHRVRTETKPLSERMDFHGQLSAQLPVAAIRVAYPKAGNSLAAAIIRDNRAIIDHKLYWTATLVESEAHYLCSILNSAPVLAQVKPLQAVGLFGARDFDKNVFSVPFPTFDPKNPVHQKLAELGKQAETQAATVDISGARTFQAARKMIRAHLAETGTESDTLKEVTELLLSVTTP